MIVVETKQFVGRSDNFQENNFKIKASAKAFKILSAGLYSNHIRAIVRELGTNAADAHISARTPEVPFLVHLPNQLEPTFSIRDYGTGLSPEDMELIYTTYFESTKTNSDEQTGCLGLGSKSPFSYTDNFTVIDYYNGAKHTYTCFTNEHGCPAIALLATEETTEPNGLEVSFGVKPQDFARFIEEAKYVYSFFKTTPKIVGQQVELTKYVPIFHGNVWKVFNGSGASRVVMGNVAYPLDMNQLGINTSIFSAYSLHVEVPIGQADMTASRESLEYTDKTKNSVVSAIKECLEVFAENMQKELDSKGTLWEAVQFYSENQLFFTKQATWQGQPIGTYIKLPKSYRCISFERGYNNVRMRLNADIWKLEPSRRNRVVIVEDDLQRGARDRVRQMLQNSTDRDGRAYLISFDPARVNEDGTTTDERAEFVACVGTLPADMFVRASNLPKVIRPKSVNGKTGPTPQVFRFLNTDGKAKSSRWLEVETVDLSAGGVYVELEHWETKGASISDIEYAIEQLTRMNKTIVVYGLRKKAMKKIAGNPKWVPIKQYINEVIASCSNDYDYAVNETEYRGYANFRSIRSFTKSIDIEAFLKDVDYCVKHHDYLDALNNFIRRLAIKVEDRTNVHARVAVLQDKYPLMFHILQHCRGGLLPTQALGEYVDMMSQKEKMNVVDNEVVF